MADDSKEEVPRKIQQENPFASLKISSFDVLRDVRRSICKHCKSSRKYYCYKCFLVVGIDRSMIPHVTLPIKVEIIKHQGEVIGKSTACHAAILAPDDVTIHDYPAIPDFPSKDKVVLVYPSENALTLSELGKDSKYNTIKNFDHVVFIDSTWHQAHKIISDPRLADIQRVQIENAITYFWRPQQKPNTCLATIEAVYYFFKEYHQYIIQREYDGEYDNLLYFFAFQYLLIKKQQQKSKRRRLDPCSTSDSSKS